MFDTAELGQRVDDEEFDKRERKLRARLLKLQYQALDRDRFGVLVDFAGVDGAGKGTTVNMLNKWMDPRWIRTIGYQSPTEEQRAHPRFWRYWRDLPPRGRIGLYLSGRYSRALLGRVYEGLEPAAFDERLALINRFEKALSDDGMLVIKFWMHLSRDHQQQRLEALSNDPALSYRVREADWRNHEHYDEFISAAETIITRTNRVNAPWHIIEGVDRNYRHLAVGEFLADELSRHLDRADDGAAAADNGDNDRPGSNHGKTIFDKLDLSLEVSKSDYRSERRQLQARLGELGREAARRGLPTVLVFEGPDAAGKGGAIRRTVWSLDARWYRVHQFAAPTDVERAHHYLWRFWLKLPRAGRVAVFDRSWYGRVLVERLEGYASEEEWRRAYSEINDFEHQIVERGTVLIKFWVQISSDEQLTRFEKRAKSPYKAWKLTDEDWRNREQWDAYQAAAHDMIQFTSTQQAPWVMVEGNDKRYARLRVLRTIIGYLEQRLESPTEE